MKYFTVLFVGLAVLLACVYAEDTRDEFEPDATIYFFDDDYAKKVGKMPSEYKKEYQIPKSGVSSPTFKVKSGSVEVSDKGVVKPKGTKYWWKNGWGYLYEIPDADKITVRYYETNATVTMTDSAGTKTDFKVRVINYANIYVNNKLDRVISEIITNGMSAYDKLYAVTEWVANNTDYDGSYYNAVDMLIYDCGDCWASTYTIIEFCKKLGLNCKERRANLDPGTGSGHRNVVCYIGDKYYIADAGYCCDPKPRHFAVREEPGGFSSGIVISTRQYIIYQYDGMEEEVTIPCEYEGNNITVFGLSGANVFIYGTVKKVNIPSCITTIGESAFSMCPNLADVVIHEDNPNYESYDRMVYTKGKGTLIFTSTNKSSVTISPLTTTIGVGALGSLNLGSLVIPGTVKKVGNSALAFSTITNITIEYGVESFGNRAFEKAKISKVVFPDSVKSIGNYSFNASSISTVVFPKNLTEVPRGCFYQSTIKNPILPDTIEVIRRQAFYYCSHLDNLSLPASLTHVEADAFDNPSTKYISHIYFAGSERRWNRIQFDTPINKKIQLHFGDYPDDENWNDSAIVKLPVFVFFVVAVILQLFL